MAIRESIDPAAAAALDEEEKKAAAREALTPSDNISAPWYVGPVLGNAADAATTLDFLKEGGTEKTSAWLLGKRPSPAAVIGLKAAEALIADAGIRLVAKKSKPLAKVLSVLTTAAPMKAAIGNMSYSKKLKARRDVGGKR